LFTEAGHISKILALAFFPPILAGFVYVFRQKYILGTFIVAFSLGLELYANHLQITYYEFFILLAYTIYESVKIIKNKNYKHLGIAAACLLIASVLGISNHTMRLWNNLTYSAETTRGKSELKTSTVGKTGLDKDYAFQYSYGLDESINLLVPNLMGGGSGGSLNTSSETYKALTAGGVDANMASQFIKQLPLYHGKQPVTSGPSYSGIVAIFLMILGLFISKGNLKWLIFGFIVVFLVFSWGDNFPAFNYLVYDYLPGFNKFRAVTMILTLVHFLIVWGAANTLHDLVEDKINWDNLKKPMAYTAAILVAIMFFGYIIVDYNGANDEAFKGNLAQSLGQEFAQKVLFAIKDDRSAMAFNDIIRGIILLLVSIGLIYFYLKQKISSKILGIGFIVLIMYDMIGVGKRFFNNDDFVNKSQASSVFEPTPADLEILKDTDPHYRVANLTTSFWADARDSYFHKSIGGYHGAKLKKMQELYEYQMTKDGRINMGVLNMLNAKYFITNNPENQTIAQRNPEALGNAWLIDTLKVVNDADLELKMVGEINTKTTAVAQTNQNLKANLYTVTENDKIMLTNYKPNELTYSFDSNQKQFAVFSEVYYRGNQDWISYIDGIETPHAKVNYTLRGMEVPAGKHEIKFIFKPKSVSQGKNIDLISSIGIGLLFLGLIFVSFKSEK